MKFVAADDVGIPLALAAMSGPTYNTLLFTGRIACADPSLTKSVATITMGNTAINRLAFAVLLLSCDVGPMPSRSPVDATEGRIWRPPGDAQSTLGLQNFARKPRLNDHS